LYATSGGLHVSVGINQLLLAVSFAFIFTSNAAIDFCGSFEGFQDLEFENSVSCTVVYGLAQNLCFDG